MHDFETRCAAAVREVADFPRPGIRFKDLSALWGNPTLGKEIQAFMAHSIQTTLGTIDAVVAIESRGFLFGVGIAQALDVPFVAVRKAGKLPGPVWKAGYALEYGEDTVEMQMGALPMGARVVIHDDVLATGGTACAAAELVRFEGGRVAGFAFILEIPGLGGREVCEKVAPVVRPLLT
ncbi:MAG: adenine phosphoribosyltransferase [Flavobacteriales bacterium]|jgi:adenine phosphoribosyltransferase